MAIMIENSKDGNVYFAVTVPKARAEYLFACLQRPLCENCGREADECKADPCEDREAKSGVFEITVHETITYSAHIEAENLEQAERAVTSMQEYGDWEPIRDSAEIEKYGYNIDNRSWHVSPVERTDFIDELAKREKLISAKEWEHD